MRLGLDEQASMSIDDRITAGDREAIHDAIVEAREDLDEVGRQLSLLLTDDADVLDRIAALKRTRNLVGESPIVRPRRKKKQETAGTDASGTERQRSRINRSESASHGR